jgi:[calcium/calmodulin-dependent protein kinase] kinase
VNAAITGNMGHLVTVVSHRQPYFIVLADDFQVRAVKRFKQLLFRRRPERIESILGGTSRIVQPPLSMRPSVNRKSKSQDTHDRRPVESALSTEGVHHEIKIDDKGRKVPHNINDMAYAKPGLRAEVVSTRPTVKGPTSSNSSAQTLPGLSDAKIVHENMSYRAPPSQPNAAGSGHPISAPTTPIGKGHAHNPLEDTLFLNIGTGEDSVSASEDSCVVSESPSNVDIDVYEAAYEEEVQRIIAQRKDQYANRRPTLYLTRRVENVKSIRDSDCIFDEGQDLRQNLKGSFKSFVTRTKEDIEARGEMQKIQEGKEGKLSRTVRNVREAKRLVEEARERVKTEERDRERERSRSATPVLRTNSSTSGISRSGTPVGG